MPAARDAATELRRLIGDAGACAVGFAPLQPVDDEDFAPYRRWVEQERYGTMAYMAAHLEIRRNPALLLADGADPAPGGTVISMAFPYFSGNPYSPGHLKFARYALGDDYHESLRQRLRAVAAHICATFDVEARVCIDTAPILERYWARRAGVGFIGRNRQLIVPGIGSHVFLAEIVTRAELPPDRPCDGECPEGCDACLRACPGSMTDARRCHSYLTIEHRGDLPEGAGLRPGRVYGCDICLEACPLSRPEGWNAPAVPCLPEFTPRPSLLSLTCGDIEGLTPESYAALMRHSPIKRAKLAGLLRNLRYLP